jgi:uncharacterized membrane protein
MNANRQTPPHTGAVAAFAAAPQRLVRAQRRLRAGLLQMLCAAAGLALGWVLPQVTGGPTVEAGKLLAQLLFSVGLGVIGVVTIVFSLLFGVVQWSASSFSPRLNLFRDDPLVWRTFAITIGVFVFCITAGLVSAKPGRVSVLVPVTAVVATLAAFAMIRALQTKAFLSLQLGEVLAAIAARGRAVIDDLYRDQYSEEADASPPTAIAPASVRRTVTWSGPPGVVQQLDLLGLVDEAARADALVVFRVGVGDTMYDAAPLADLSDGDLPDQVIRDAVVRGVERSFDQDPMFAVRLLTDIALRAVSAAVNDPATAVEALDATEGLLRQLAVRDLWVAAVADGKGNVRVRLVLPTWEDFLRTGLEDLLPFTTAIPMVLERMLRLLAALIDTSTSARHAAVIRLRGQVEAQLAACRSD